MLDRKVLENDLYLLAKSFYRVIEVNLDDDTYFEVKVAGAEPHTYSKLQTWVDAFVESGGVHPDDIKAFKDFFVPLKLKAALIGIKTQRVFYRRWINGQWRYVYMEAIPMDIYTSDDPIVLIVVKDIEDYVKEFCQQVKGAHLD